MRSPQLAHLFTLALFSALLNATGAILKHKDTVKGTATAASLWGTVNFTSIKAHKAFTRENIKLVESYAERIQKMLIEIDIPKRSTLRE